MKLAKKRLIALLLVLVLIPLGLYTKVYSGFGYEFVNNKLGGVFYELFWCLFFYFPFYWVRPLKITLWVFLVTSFLEFTQLLNVSFLQVIRSNFIGRTIIGSSFSWTDFIYYAIGSFIGFLTLNRLNKISEVSEN